MEYEDKEALLRWVGREVMLVAVKLDMVGMEDVASGVNLISNLMKSLMVLIGYRMGSEGDAEEVLGKIVVLLEMAYREGLEAGSGESIGCWVQAKMETGGGE